MLWRDTFIKITTSCQQKNQNNFFARISNERKKRKNTFELAKNVLKFALNLTDEKIRLVKTILAFINAISCLFLTFVSILEPIENVHCIRQPKHLNGLFFFFGVSRLLPIFPIWSLS